MKDKYPPFACQHCGLANGDMFTDWWMREHNGETPPNDVYEVFEAYRIMWRRMKKLEVLVRSINPLGVITEEDVE